MQQQQQVSDNHAAPEMLSFGGSSTPRMTTHIFDRSGGEAEAASPISSRPPASATINFDDSAGHDHHCRGGGGGGSSGSSNRWPRQETLALLKIRSEMDVAFRDATLKGPLWDEVSRRLGELGYVRSAKKCKEKFENVHKYYKRTKEGRAGRQDGKTYRFFTQLEAMQGQPPPSTDATGTAAANLLLPTSSQGPPQSTTVPLASVGNVHVQFATPVSVGIGGSTGGRVLQPYTMYSSWLGTSGGAPLLTTPPVGISFSSDSASSDSNDDDEVDDIMSEEEDSDDRLAETAAAAGSSQKRKRSGSSSKHSRMMDFFEGLMKQMMQKQEAMQQKFLETIEKREQDRSMTEDAWKQHEASRVSREQQLATQERAMAASRDAAIVSFIEKITGQTIQFPPQPQPQPVYTTTTAVHHLNVAVEPPPPAPTLASAPLQSRQQQIQPQNNTALIMRVQQQNQMPPPCNNEVIMAVPERQIPPQPQDGGGGSSSSEPASSSRWPKVEVLALIKLRSNLEDRYQEAGPKGPLWEEISAGMQRMGYHRSSKRCKEKWENINKYFKKVKESNKKRPEDAKTCPYFNELDALYQRKKLGSSSSSSIMLQSPQQHQQGYLGVDQDQSSTPAPPTRSIVPGSVVQQAAVSVLPQVEQITERADGSNDQESNIAGGSRKPEDIMMEQKHLDLEEGYNQQKMDELEDNSEEDEDDEEERKMGYKIDEFQRPPTNNENGRAPSSSFNITMVQ